MNYKRFEIRGYSQGTTYAIIYYAADRVISQKQTDSLLAGFDRSVSLYRPSSLICQFNRSVHGIAIDKDFTFLVKKAIEINRATMGYVDITVKPLVDVWGFGVHKTLAFPDSAKVRAILKKVGPDQIRLTGNSLFKNCVGTQVDLNGIAQGYSVDLLASLLEDYHIDNYMVELGGELRVKGRKPDHKPFTVGIESIAGDDINSEPMREVVEMDNGAITTSGNYRKHREAGGKQISHLINPLTGYPVQNEMISVTVYAKNAITADGYDNGFMAMGLTPTIAFLSKHTDMGAYIIYRKTDGSIADTTAGLFPKKVKR